MDTCRTMIVVVLGALAPLTGAQTPAPKTTPAARSDDFTAGQQWFKKNDFALAATAFAQFTKTQPNDPRAASAWLQESFCHLRLNRGPEALRCWNWILQRYPASPQAPEALEQLIGYQEKRDRPGEAADLSNRLLTLYPQHPATVRLLSRRAATALAAQRYEEVVRLLLPVREMLTAEQRRQLDFAQLSVEAKANPAKLLTTADAALAADDPAKAVPLLEAFLAQPEAGRVAEAKTKLGWARYCLPDDPKNGPRAEALWEEVIRLGPPTDEWVGESQWHMVQLLAGPRGKLKEAAARCAQVTRDFAPGTFRHEQALYTRAWLFWTQKQWSAAQAAFEEFIKAYPHKAAHPPIIAYLRDCEKGLAKEKGLP